MQQQTRRYVLLGGFGLLLVVFLVHHYRSRIRGQDNRTSILHESASAHLYQLRFQDPPVAKAPMDVEQQGGWDQLKQRSHSPEGAVTGVNSCKMTKVPEDGLDLCYWHDYDYDKEFESSVWEIREEPRRKRFLNFQWDIGGFNNIRLSLETMVALAIATSRVLVLPPRQRVYLMTDRPTHGVVDFYDIDALKQVIEVMDVTEFLHYARTSPDFQEERPGNETQESNPTSVYEYFTRIGLQPHWEPEKQFLAIPRYFKDYTINEKRNQVLLHFKKEQRTMIRYTKEMDNHALLYIPVNVNYKDPEAPHERYLLPFYTFVLSDYAPLDAFLRRSIRNHLHYNEEILGQSSRIVRHLRSLNGTYIALHVRRGDFQYKATLLEAEELVKNVAEFLDHAPVVYIATDEKNKSYFSTFSRYSSHIFFLDDFPLVKANVSADYFGHIEQVVCANAALFIGTYWSTFTAFINRMRGYYGYDDSTSYYTMESMKYETHSRSYPIRPYWMREFDAGWRGLETRFAAADLVDFAHWHSKKTPLF